MLSFRIALRYLRSRKTHAAVNVISIISMAGLAVATAATVVVLSVYNGFAGLQASHLSVIDPHVRVEAATGAYLADADSLMEEVRRVPSVREAAIVVEGHAVATAPDGSQLPVRFKGVGPGYERVCDLKTAVVEGELHLDGSRPCATIAIGVAQNLRIAPDGYTSIELLAPRRRGRLNPGNMLASMRADTVAVSAVFQINTGDYDADMVYVPLDAARNLMDYEEEATAIEIAVDGSIDAAADELRGRLGPDVVVKTREQLQETAYKMVAIEKWVTFAMLVFILLIASFNIISTLSMMVVEKRDNMRTLRALGASRLTVRRVFLWLGWLVAAVGGIIGLIIGVLLSLAQQYGGFIKFSADPTTLVIDTYPVRVEPLDLLIVAAAVAVIGLVTSAITASFAVTRNKD